MLLPPAVISGERLKLTNVALRDVHHCLEILAANANYSLAYYLISVSHPSFSPETSEILVWEWSIIIHYIVRIPVEPTRWWEHSCCEWSFWHQQYPFLTARITTFILISASSHLPCQQPSRCQQSPACQQPAITSQLPVIMNRWCGYLWWRIWHDYRVYVFTTWLINFGNKITDKTMNKNFSSQEYWVSTIIPKVEIWSDEDWKKKKGRGY